MQVLLSETVWLVCLYCVKHFDWCAFIVWKSLIGVRAFIVWNTLIGVPFFVWNSLIGVPFFVWNSLIGMPFFVKQFDWCAYVLLYIFFSIKCHYKSPVVEMYVSFVCHLVITVQLIFTHCAVTFAPEHLMKVVCYMLLYINMTWNNNAEDLMSTFNWVHPVQCDSLRCPASQASKCKLRNDVCLNFFGFSTCATISSSKELCISFWSLSFNIVYCPIIQAILYSKKSGQNYLHLFM